MINLYKEIKLIVDMATSLWQESTDGKGKDGWIVFFEARSFWLMLISLIFSIVPMFGIVIEIPQETVVEATSMVLSAILMIWAFIERMNGKKSIVWNTDQANSAINQAQQMLSLVKTGRGVFSNVV